MKRVSIQLEKHVVAGGGLGVGGVAMNLMLRPPFKGFHTRRASLLRFEVQTLFALPSFAIRFHTRTAPCYELKKKDER